MNWAVIVSILVGSLAVVVARPWRFWWPRTFCPQCKCVLPRWNLWGWKEEWTCRTCGCQISR
jgi:hypothetical protein